MLKTPHGSEFGGEGKFRKTHVAGGGQGSGRGGGGEGGGLVLPMSKQGIRSASWPQVEELSEQTDVLVHLEDLAVVPRDLCVDLSPVGASPRVLLAKNPKLPSDLLIPVGAVSCPGAKDIYKGLPPTAFLNDPRAGLRPKKNHLDRKKLLADYRDIASHLNGTYFRGGGGN